MAPKGLLEEVPLSRDLTKEEASRAVIWGQGFPGRGDGTFRGPQRRVLGLLEDQKEGPATEAQWAEQKVMGKEYRDGPELGHQPWVWDFILSAMGSPWKVLNGGVT